MNTETIGNLVKKTGQIDPAKLGREFITYIDIASIDRETKRIIQPQIIRASEAPSRARKQIQTGDVLISTVRPNLNTITRIASNYNSEIASTGFCVLRPDKDFLDSDYLFFFAQTSDFVSRLIRLAIGAGYPAVSDDDILDCEIPLAPLPEQHRIAELLDKADHLRRTRRDAAQLSDTFLQAVFVRMFGDPVRNEMGWNSEPIEELCAKVIDYRGRTPPYSDNGIRHITASCIKDSRIDWAQCKYVSEETYSEYMTRGFPERGDVLFTTEAPLGETAVVDTDEQFSLAQRIVLLRPDKLKLGSHYLHSLLSHPRFFVKLGQYATGSTVVGIRSESLVAIPIYVPPLTLQEKFARIVQQFERLRAQQREAERQAEHLFQTLLHRAFSGAV